MPNPFAGSRGYARLSNIFMVPMFRLLPIPGGFVLLTVTRRRTGKQSHRPVRAVRRDNTLYAVAMLGERSDWLKNVRRQAHLGVKIGGKSVQGRGGQGPHPAQDHRGPQTLGRRGHHGRHRPGAGDEMTERQRISSGSPYEPIVGFSRAVRVGDTGYVAGPRAWGDPPEAGKLVGAG